MAGVRGVIFDPGGNQHIRYSWGLGNKPNNQVEVLVAFMGLTMIPEDKTQSITVIGDS